MTDKKSYQRETVAIAGEYSLPAQRVADLFLDIGTYLLASGAHSGRLLTNLGRMAEAWHMELHIHPTFKGLLVTVRDKNDSRNAVTCYEASPPHSICLENLTLVSRLTWRVSDEKLPIGEVEQAFSEIKQKKGYPVLGVAVAVGCACCGLCLFSNGDYLNALVTFAASSLGYLVQVGINRCGYNPMVAISLAAFFTTLLTALGSLLQLGAHPEAAMATAVLYLVPGVPLINAVIDLIEGYLSSSVNRALFAGFMLLCIAAGMTVSIGLIGIRNF